MKKRTREENAAYSRAQREKKRRASVPPPVSPRITSTVSPAPPISGTARIVRYRPPKSPVSGDLVRTLLAKVAILEADQGDINGSKTTTSHATLKDDDTEALRKPVIADKVDRISRYGRTRS